MVYSSKTLEILAYTEENPITCQSEKMNYLPLDELDRTRLPDVVENFGREDVMLPLHESQRINALGNNDKCRQHMADVAMALLYIPCGGLDEAHDIVLPYSWPEASEQGGPAVEDSAASHEAKYAHAFVHRKEGEFLGELRMVGFRNACFWFDTTGYHPLFPVVKQNALQIGQKFGGNTQKLVEEAISPCPWSPDRFTQLCEKALAQKDAELERFCSEVTRMEWKLLLDQCNQIVNPENLVLKA